MEGQKTREPRQDPAQEENRGRLSEFSAQIKCPDQVFFLMNSLKNPDRGTGTVCRQTVSTRKARVGRGRSRERPPARCGGIWREKNRNPKGNPERETRTGSERFPGQRAISPALSPRGGRAGSQPARATPDPHALSGRAPRKDHLGGRSIGRDLRVSLGKPSLSGSLGHNAV